MAVIRWGREGDIFSELSRMQSDLSRLFGEFDSRSRGGYKASVYPPLNIYNDGESFIVRAELPGVDPKSLDLEVTGDTLTLRGERKLPELEEGSSYHRRERDFGQFRRSFSLPERVDGSKVMATCEDGILEIRLPHAEEAKARKISVKAS
jgi:HSP20 family protein